MATHQQRTSGETIYEAALALHNAGKQISRPILAKVTGLTKTIIDHHVDRLVDNTGRMRRLGGGYYEIVEVFPPNRAISKTVLPDGRITIEIGDDVLQLSPGEARILGGNLLGEATEFAQLRGDRDVSDRVARLQHQREEDKKKIDALTHEVARLHKHQQAELAFD